MKFVLIFCLVLIVFPFLCYSKNIEIIGAVVAVELSRDGHSYPIYKTVEIPKSYLVVRIEEAIKGSEESKYILVNFRQTKGIADFIDQRGKWKFNLSRNKRCDSNLRDLQFVFFGGKKISGVLPRLMRISGYENEVLPFASKLSCYETDLKKTQNIPSAIDESKHIDNEYDTFVLEDALWLNPVETPLKVYFGRLDEVANTTNKQINEFKFGCVSVQDNKYKIKHSFEVEKSTFPANERSYLTISNVSSVYKDELYTCYQMKSKVTVIWVKFKDNSIWELE